jgi:alkanesulfonate monooxygenase SsuD/methylene tetrahydromethanopterin reductase-like flavin-dependent oxidoreductase (luciferase family)
MGLGMHIHSLGRRDEEMRPAKSAQLAERFGYHSVWCSDHILVTSKPGADSHALCLSGAKPVPNTCPLRGAVKVFLRCFRL